MTKEAIRDMVNDAINERIQEAINAYKNGLDSAVKEKDWSRASEFEACMYDYDNVRECIIPVVDEVFGKIEIDDDSHYKRKWEKLKEKIKDRALGNYLDSEEDAKKRLYYTAYAWDIRNSEDTFILSEMKDIEEGRDALNDSKRINL